MRFNSNKRLPPSQWAETPEETEAVARKLLASRGLYGLDLEADGLGFPIEKVSISGTIKHAFAGDGLGANMEVVCLAFDGARYGVDVGTERRKNLEILAPVIHATQDRSCTYNGIFDQNIWDYTVRRMGLGQYVWDRVFADAMALYQHWDEDAQKTGGQRTLKARARDVLGIPMSSFDDLILSQGGIRACLNNDALRERTRRYCTRDAWATLGLVAAGQPLAEALPWCAECSHCGRPAYRKLPNDLWECYDCGPVAAGKMLTMWDWYRQMDVPFMLDLKRMQQEGVCVDLEYIRSYEEPMVRCLRALEETFQAEAAAALVEMGGTARSISPSSPAQLASFYFDHLDMSGNVIGMGLKPLRKTTSGSPATDERTLDELALQDAPGAKALMDYRSTAKVLGTYVHGFVACVWSETGRIHSRIRADAVTTRITSRGPNTTNTPRDPLAFTEPPQAARPAESIEELAALWEISVPDAVAAWEAPQFLPKDHSMFFRKAIVAPRRKLLLGADYSQLELRLSATESGDEALIHAINKGMDLHSATAVQCFGKDNPTLTYELLAEAQDFKEVRQPEHWFTGPAAYRWASLAHLFMPGGVEEEARARAPFTTLGVEGFTRNLLDALGALRAQNPGVDQLPWRQIFERGRFDDPTLGRTHVFKNETDVQDDLVDIWRMCANAVRFDDPESAWKALVNALKAADKPLGAKRQSAKSSIFGTIYDISATGLAIQITKATGVVCTKEEAARILHVILHEAYPGLGAMMKRLKDTAQTLGYVRTQMGRYRHPAGVLSGNRSDINRALRQSANAPIQGLGANIMQAVMVTLNRNKDWIGLGAQLILQIYDELVATAPEENAAEALEVMVRHMKTAHRLHTPVRLLASGGLGLNLADLK